MATTKKGNSPRRAPAADSAGGAIRGASERTRESTDRTRENILRHATREFSTRGFDGARVDRIADRCRLSKNTLYYHFGSKDGLITAALERMYENLRQRQAEAEIPTDDPKGALSAIVEHTFKAFLEHPEIIRLLNEENLYKAVHVKKANFLKQLYDPLFLKLSEVLEAGSKQGVFRKGVDPVYVYITISSMAYHYISNMFTLEIALGRDISSPEAYDGWQAHILDVVMSYCSNSPTAQAYRGKVAVR